MVWGALMLVEGPIPQLRIQLPTTLALAVPLALISFILVRLAYLSHRRKSVTGGQGMIGETGVAKSDIHNDGKVLVHGEYWNASSSGPISAGAKVRVISMHGLRLEVEAVNEEKS
jgi:membrane-bound serine protease (ClpP class)